MTALEQDTLGLNTCGRIWRCECGNDDQTRIVTPPDGEVICGKCGMVLGQVQIKEDAGEEHRPGGWDEEADLYRKILEERVGKKGWQF